MTRSITIALCFALCGITGCATTGSRGTLAELEGVAADLDEIYLEDSLERAAESYRRYLAETQTSERTPEAMRRLADLQIEQVYGVIGRGDIVELPAPDAASGTAPIAKPQAAMRHAAPGESDQDFETRASAREQLKSRMIDVESDFPDGAIAAAPAGPREAIETYRKILATYPHYERNDKVLYQMSRAYDEIGLPDEAMQVMARLVAEYPQSRFVDEVYFRRGEYFFVRKQYLDAENAYGAIIRMGPASDFYELALYKLGWTLYKQEFYEEALHRYFAMLDHRQSAGYDFDANLTENDEHRIADTFRVISLSFSNLGGPEVVDEYFLANGKRSYADKIYSNLAEFYFGKLRYDDAASVYKSFVQSNPNHEVAPNFSMRVIEIYAEAGFPQLVVESKKAFATVYALNAAYWNHFDAEDRPEVVEFLKTNLTDLAGHYHALYQNENLVDEQPANFSEAKHWYREALNSFPSDADSPQINYRLADLLLENDDFGEAAIEYERTAYEYEPHEAASAAAYAAVYAHRENLKAAGDERKLEVKKATVASSLRFADTFHEHEQAPVVLGAAVDDLYEMNEFNAAIDSAQELIGRYPDAEPGLIRGAWTVVAHASLDLTLYPNAEQAYAKVLGLTPTDDDSRPAIVDGLAASIYKQGEQANTAGDFRAAADHFLRIKDVAPTSDIRSSAEYDAAAALIKVEDWALASSVLEDFRASHPQHELGGDATKQLAFIYREDGQLERSAAEHERIAAESDDLELRREALLTAGDLYDEAKALDEAIRVYESYVGEYSRPLDVALETRTRLAEIFNDRQDVVRYHEELQNIIDADRTAGHERSDRSRYLAAKAALVLAEDHYHRFAELRLTQPFEESLAEKQARMDTALRGFEDLVQYEVAEVTAAATYYMAEIFLGFSAALLDSERPAGLSDTEKVDYELVIEEEAFPFEEQAIGVHEKNFELLTTGIYNAWVRKSMDKLAQLMPGRYAKKELSGGFVGSIDVYAYRMPIAPPPGAADHAAAPNTVSENSERMPATTAEVINVAGGDLN